MRKEWSKPVTTILGVEETKAAHKEHYGIVGDDHICPKCNEMPFPFDKDYVGFSCENTNSHVTDCKGIPDLPGPSQS